MVVVEYFIIFGSNFVACFFCRLECRLQCIEWLFFSRIVGMGVCLLDFNGGFFSGTFVLEKLRGREEDAFRLGRCFTSTDVHFQSKLDKMMEN